MVKECYDVLGSSIPLKPIPENSRLHPSHENMYQPPYPVIGPYGEQLDSNRTNEMHKIAARNAAHWKYRGRIIEADDKRFTWLRQLGNGNDLKDSAEFRDS
jgi:(p)ppGpp synthase/HD superfamily hydrolase